MADDSIRMTMKDVLRRFMKSTVSEAYNTLRCKRKDALKAAGIDILFFASFMLMNFGFTTLVPQPQNLPFNAGNKVLALLGLLIGFSALILLVYSFFKFLVIYMMRGMFKKTRTDFTRFWKFYRSNALMVATFLLLLLVFSAGFILTIRIDVLATVRDVFMIVFGIMIYLALNTMHVLFVSEDAGVGNMIVSTFDIIFTNLRKYLVFLLVSTALAGAIIGIYYAFDWAILLILGSAISAMPVFYGYGLVNILVTASLALASLSFIRMYLFVLVPKLKRRPGNA